MKRKHAGPTLEEAFAALGELEEVRALAAKKMLALELERLMAAQNVSKAGLARRMATSRDVVYRLLDPRDTAVTLATLAKASGALDCVLEVRLRREPAKRTRRGRVAA
jgi:antitoxin HicB